MEREKVPSSDCDEDEDEDFNLLTIINEHSEGTGIPIHKMAKMMSPILMK